MGVRIASDGTQPDSPRITLEVEGHVDLEVAERLRESILLLRGNETEFLVDFRRARLEDRALALIASALGSTGTRVRVHGLGLHQDRLLRYLGVLPLSGDVTGAARLH